MKDNKRLVWTSVLTGIGASLCCITPVLAMISGASGLAASFSWMEPLRPYLIAVTVGVLGYAWYQQLKPVEDMDCACDTRTGFMHSRWFLGLVTVFSVAMLAFPYYSKVFYPQSDSISQVVDMSKVHTVELAIEGMTCTGCEEHINHSVGKLDGVVDVQSSYADSKSVIHYDSTMVTMDEIKKAVDATGYQIVNIRHDE